MIKLTECYLSGYGNELYFECESESGRTFTSSIRLNGLDFDRIAIGINTTRYQEKQLRIIANKLKSLIKIIKFRNNNGNILKVDQILKTARYKKYKKGLPSFLACINTALVV